MSLLLLIINSIELGDYFLDVACCRTRSTAIVHCTNVLKILQNQKAFRYIDDRYVFSELWSACDVRPEKSTGNKRRSNMDLFIYPELFEMYR